MDITIKDVLANIENLLEGEEKKKALTALLSVGIDLSQPNKKLTGTRVLGYTLDGIFFIADSHKDVFLKVITHVLNHKPEYTDRLFSIKGRTKTYFSRSPKDFKNDYEKIRGHNVYADTNDNAVQLNKKCQKVLRTFGILPQSFFVITD